MSAQPQTLERLREGQGTGIAPRKPMLLDLLDNPRTKAGLAHVAGKAMNPDRILQLATTAVKNTPLLLQCHPKSVLGAVMASTALGLEFNTVLQHAFLIPYKKRAFVDGRWLDVYECQFQVGYRGFVVLAYRSPSVKDLRFNAIRRGDTFNHMEGSRSFLEYSKNLEERGELLGAFSHAHMGDGGESAVVLAKSDVLKIREKSETFRFLRDKLAEAKRGNNAKDIQKAQEKFDSTPWMQWDDPMWAKTALKQHTRLLPLNPGDQLATGALLDGAGDRDDAGTIIDLSAMSDPDVAKAVAEGEYAPTVAGDGNDDGELQEQQQQQSGSASEGAASAGAPPQSTAAAAPSEGARASRVKPRPAAGQTTSALVE